MKKGRYVNDTYTSQRVILYQTINTLWHVRAPYNVTKDGWKEKEKNENKTRVRGRGNRKEKEKERKIESDRYTRVLGVGEWCFHRDGKEGDDGDDDERTDEWNKNNDWKWTSRQVAYESEPGSEYCYVYNVYFRTYVIRFVLELFRRSVVVEKVRWRR